MSDDKPCSCGHFHAVIDKCAWCDCGPADAGAARTSATGQAVQLTDEERASLRTKLSWCYEPTDRAIRIESDAQQLETWIESILAARLSVVTTERDELKAAVVELAPAGSEAHYAQLMDDVANGDGFTTEIRGVKIQKCDEYGQTDTDYKLRLAQVYVEQERQLVDMVTAERDAALARNAELEKAKTHWHMSCKGAEAEAENLRAELDNLRDRVTALADEWDGKARMATDQANAMSGDRRQPYLMDSAKYLRRASELRALVRGSDDE